MFTFKKKNLEQQLNGLAEHSMGYRKLNGRKNRKFWFYFIRLIVLIHLFAIPVHASDTTQSFTPTPNLTSNKFTDLRHSGITIPEYKNQGLNAPSKAGLYFILSCVCIFTVIGNVMVILTATIFRKLRTIPNMFIISLASADLTIGTVVLPMWSHYVIGGKWDLGAFWCDIWTSVDVLSVTASIGTLCAISLDRFVAITMPFKYSTKMTRLRARFIIGFIWIVSAAIAFIPINLGLWKTNEPDDQKFYDDVTNCEFKPNTVYAVVSSCISFYIPLIIMVCAYSIVFKIAIQKRSKIRNREGVYRRASMPGSRTLLWGKREYRAVFTMGIIMGTFVICWLPFFIANIVQVFCEGCISAPAFMMINCLGYINSFFNPIIYCHSLEFRRAFKRLLLCGLCRDGFRQTSRASLAVSYTPSMSSRSSVRTESSLFQLSNFLSESGLRKRTSRFSTSSKRSNKPSPTNGRASPASSNGQTFLEPKTMVYGFRSSINRFDSDTTSGSTNSVGTASNGSRLLTALEEASVSVANGVVRGTDTETKMSHIFNNAPTQRPRSAYKEVTPDLSKTAHRKSSSLRALDGIASGGNINTLNTKDTDLLLHESAESESSADVKETDSVSDSVVR